MWFEQKCLPEIQQVVYYNMETCNQQHGAACSQVYYKDKTVAYRTIWSNFGVPIGAPESMCLHICRTWLETEYQTRFKKRCNVWLIDAWAHNQWIKHANVLGARHPGSDGNSSFDYPLGMENYMGYADGKPIVPRAVRVEA